ncbi:DUF551 domain-containing protein [Escherichia coli]|nr:DUF551 domain-containing protein [Escherichia coli]
MDYQALREAAEVAKEETTWQNLQAFHAAATPEVVLALLDVLDASLEAEQVAWLHSDNGLGIPAITRSKNIADSWLSKGWYVQPLYIAKPVPVTPDGWISCSERMPDDGQHVIILCDGAFVLYAQYRDGEFFDIVRNGDEFFETQSRNVTDWMPLPEPPQEVNRG